MPENTPYSSDQLFKDFSSFHIRQAQEKLGAAGEIADPDTVYRYLKKQRSEGKHKVIRRPVAQKPVKGKDEGVMSRAAATLRHIMGIRER